MEVLDTATIRRQNKLNIFQIISKIESFTKNDLAEQTGLTQVTINKIINDLESTGFVVGLGQTRSVSGRPAKIYCINQLSACFIGVNISPEMVTSAACDINMNPMFHSSVMLYGQTSFLHVWDVVKREVAQLRMRVNTLSKTCTGIGITLPGIIDPAEKIVNVLPRMPGWDGVPIQALAEKEFGCPVEVDNDINSCVGSLRERYPDNSSIALLVMQGGIGGSVILNGILMRGRHGMANELGHLSIDMHGKQCHCGNRGCVEMYASDYAMIADMVQARKDGVKSILWDICSGSDSNISIETMIQAAVQGDALCVNRFKESAECIRILLNNLVRLYELEHIVIQSLWLSAMPEMFEIVKNDIVENSIYFHNSRSFGTTPTLEVDMDPDVRLHAALRLAHDEVLRKTI